MGSRYAMSLKSVAVAGTAAYSPCAYVADRVDDFVVGGSRRPACSAEVTERDQLPQRVGQVGEQRRWGDGEDGMPPTLIEKYTTFPHHRPAIHLRFT